SGEAEAAKVDPALEIRWRACFGDIEKRPVPQAFDSASGCKLLQLFLTTLWCWVDKLLDELKPQKVTVVSLCAVIYEPKDRKADRRIKRINCTKFSNWYKFKELVELVYINANGYVHVDFDCDGLGPYIDLMLLEEAALAQTRAVPLLSGARARPATATMIQENVIAGVLAAEQAGTGWAIAIQDQWRCPDTNCGNHPYTCWISHTPGQPDCFEKQLPVNGNIIKIWARGIDAQLCTVLEPSDNVRLALVRAKDCIELDKQKRRVSSRGEGEGDGNIAALTKLLIVGQLKQLSQAQLAPPVATLLPPTTWEPLKYDHWQEILEHTLNFWDWFRTTPSGLLHQFIMKMWKEVVLAGRLNINLIMDPSENGIPMTLWVEYYGFPPGVLLQLRKAA
ncbi:hypothetical protein EJ02DRAFT_333557, partial [Clathrospora elynae]